MAHGTILRFLLSAEEDLKRFPEIVESEVSKVQFKNIIDDSGPGDDQ